MTTTTAEQTRTVDKPAEAKSRGEVAKFQPPRLPYHHAIEERFGVKAAEWKALVEAVFPLASSVDSVVLALSYCKARKLDPFKRVVHIVPIWDKNYVAPSGKRGRYVDTIWPGIGELRTTAFRTKQYAGADPCQFGPMIDRVFTLESENGERRNITVKFPEWAQLTVYRMIDGQRVPIPGPRVYWLETYGRMGRSDLPNEMWQRRPVGQIEKCAEAAALRRGFPEELGDEHTDDETGTLIGPDRAKDVTPRPTREAATEETAEDPYAFITEDGEHRTYDDPNDAARTFTALLRECTTKGALDGLWESNTLAAQMRERGRVELADALSNAYAETIAAFNKPKDSKKAEAETAQGGAAAQGEASPQTQTGTASQGSQAQPAAYKPAPEPQSPMQSKKKGVEWAPWVDWTVAEIRRMPRERIAQFMDENKAEFDFIAESRRADWEKIELAIDARRTDG